MPIDPAVLEDHIARRGPQLHHVTSAEAVPATLTEGLVPGSQRGHRLHHGFLATRDDHVYLCDLLTTGVVELPGARALLLVDLRERDPALVDPDEDCVQQSYWRPGGPWLSLDHPPPERLMAKGAEEAGQDGALASWADETPGFDAPEIAAKSLDMGRVAYRGVVPASAICQVHPPSEGASFFDVGAASHLRTDVALPAPPPLGFYMTEIERAYALAARVIDECSTLAGHPPSAPTRFALPEEALPDVVPAAGASPRLAALSGPVALEHPTLRVYPSVEVFEGVKRGFGGNSSGTV